jgi:hypothetical protein
LVKVSRSDEQATKRKRDIENRRFEKRMRAIAIELAK